MESGHFYFVKDTFYNELASCNLLTNKYYSNGGGRPCHYCFPVDDYYWMIPISSKTQKYHRLYNNKVEKRGFCDTIRFGYVNGKEKAFLIQNCFPVTQEYIESEYRINKNTVPVTISKELSTELNGLIRKVIRFYNRGINLPLTDLNKIFAFLAQKKEEQ